MEIIATRRWLEGSVGRQNKHPPPLSALTTICGSSSWQIPPCTILVLWLITHRLTLVIKRIAAIVNNQINLHDFILFFPGCGGILTSRQGIISSPLHPESYPHGANCKWIIRARPGHVVRLQWLTFALELHPNCRFDSVKVYDNTTVPNTGGLVGRYQLFQVNHYDVAL